MKLLRSAVYASIIMLVVVSVGRVNSYAQACNINVPGTCPPAKPICQPTYGGHGVCIVDPNGPPIGGCTAEGCGDPKCGAGYSCDEGECVFNTTCVGNVIQVPYTGPQIETLSKLLALIYNILFPGALLIGVIMIIKGGYELMTSEGNPQLARAGQEDLTAAVAGTIFIVMSGFILRMVIVQILGGTVGF